MTDQPVVAEPSSVRIKGLFRPEALSNRYKGRASSVFVSTTIGQTLMSVAAGVVSVFILGLAWFGSVTPAIMAEGVLRPMSGMQVIRAPRDAVVRSIDVAVGRKAKAGDVLISLSNPSVDIGNDVLQAANMRYAKARVEAARTALAVAPLIEQAERDRLVDRAASRDVGNARLERHATSAAARYPDSGRGHPVPNCLSSTTAKADCADTWAALTELDLSSRSHLADLKRDLAAAEADLAGYLPSSEILLRAGRDGIVAEINANVGGTVTTGAPLMTVSPAQSDLIGVIMVPSRAIDYVHPGQRLRLRLTDFPYQHYGDFPATVLEISEVTMTSEDVSALRMPFVPREEVYKVKVALKTRVVSSEGSSLALRPGMLLETEIAQKERPLWSLVVGEAAFSHGRTAKGAR